MRGIRSGVGVAAGRQEVALRVRARRGHTPLSYCPEEEDGRGRSGGGLGRWRSWARQVSQVSGWASLLFNFSVLFYFFLLLCFI